MKRLFAVSISTIFILMLGMAAFADETVTELNGNKQIDVQAKSIYISPDNMYTEPISGSNASLTTQSGTQISVSVKDAMLDGLMLNVTETLRSDKEAYSWISDLMKGISDNFIAYDIFFTDSDDNKITVSGEVTVSITTPDGYSDIQVYYIDASEKPEEINSEQSNGKTVFIAKSFNYYVLAEKASSGSTTAPAESGNQDAPQTGYTSNWALWITLLFVSSGVLMSIIIINKHRETNSK